MTTTFPPNANATSRYGASIILTTDRFFIKSNDFLTIVRIPYAWEYFSATVNFGCGEQLPPISRWFIHMGISILSSNHNSANLPTGIYVGIWYSSVRPPGGTEACIDFVCEPNAGYLSSDMVHMGVFYNPPLKDIAWNRIEYNTPFVGRRGGIDHRHTSRSGRIFITIESTFIMAMVRHRHRHPVSSDDLLLEFEDSAVTTMSLSNLSLDGFTLPPPPGMVKSPSLGSFSTTSTTDCDCCSSSDDRSLSSPSPPLYNLSSPRAIFDTYWSSPSASSSSPSRTRKYVGGNNKISTTSSLGEEDVRVLVRLQATLRLPSMIDDENDTPPPEQPQEAEQRSNRVRQPSRSSSINNSLDDTLVDYHAPGSSSSSQSTRTQRRQILPTPPPPPSPHTADVSPSLIIPPSSSASSPLLLPRHILPCQSQALSRWWYFGMMSRPWSSTSALLQDSSAKQQREQQPSCLRKSRYSFSGTISPSPSSSSHCSTDGNDDDDDNTNNKLHLHNRSVSFYSQVSVLEFTVPQEKRSQEGWSKYFV